MRGEKELINYKMRQVTTKEKKDRIILSENICRLQFHTVSKKSGKF